MTIDYVDGLALQSCLASNSNVPATLNPALHLENALPNLVADFTSHGPSIDYSIKPELVAVGQAIYTATEALDSSGDLYDPTRYTTVQGSSFAAAMVAGAAALVKQANPGFSAAQIKSALVNTASVNPNDIAGNSDSGEPLIAAVGAWKLNAAATLAPGATVAPATVSFGWVGPGSVTSPVHLTVTNVGKAAAAFKISVTPDPATPDQDTSDVVSVSPGTLLLAAGQQADVDVTLQGGFTVPASTTASLALPAPALTCACLTGILRATAYRSISCRCMTVSSARRATRADGHRDQPIRCGVEQRGSGNGPGRPDLPGPGGGLTTSFYANVRPAPAINANGVLDAASFQVGKGFAPGSYISIYGKALSDATRDLSTSFLPFSMSAVSVSFQSPDGKQTWPGRLWYVSPTQINLQIPWEL
jgi:hypothetical protein